jgi:hypothetical protein
MTRQPRRASAALILAMLSPQDEEPSRRRKSASNFVLCGPNPAGGLSGFGEPLTPSESCVATHRRGYAWPIVLARDPSIGGAMVPFPT